MTWRVGGLRVTVDYFGILLVTGMLLLDRSGAMGAALLACGLHEAGHAAAMAVLGVRLKAIRLCPWGIRMERRPGEVSRGAAFGIAAAGPTVNLLAALVAWPISQRLAAIQAACGLFNLLPLEGMDGGDLLRLALSACLSEGAVDAVQRVITVTLALCGAAAGAWLLLYARNPTLLLASLYLLFLLLWQKSRS